MGKKNRSKKIADPGNAAGFKNNPFGGMHFDVVDKSSEEELQRQKDAKKAVEKKDNDLSVEDRRMLKEMGGDISLETGEAIAPKKKMSFNIERKGRGGKTVTKVFGLAALDLAEEMQLVAKVKKGLGTGARFVDDILEIQGDQRQRAKDWFAKEGYKVD